MYAGIDSLSRYHCLGPHFNYKEMTKLVRIMACCLTGGKATPPSGMWKLKLAPSSINQPLHRNYLLTKKIIIIIKKSCSSSHVEGEKRSAPGISDSALFHRGIIKVFCKPKCSESHCEMSWGRWTNACSAQKEKPS